VNRFAGRKDRRGSGGSAGALVVALAVGLSASSWAHDPFEITTDAHIAGVELRLHTTLSLLTAGRICLPDRGRQPLLRPAFEGARATLESCARGFYLVTEAGGALPVRALRLALTVEDDLDLTVTYPRPTRSPLGFDALYLRRISNPSAGAVLTVTGERAFLGQQVLRADSPTLSVSLDPDSAAPDANTRSTLAPPPSFAQFLALGVRHILTGYDHLFFLLGLLIACRTLRAALGVVTCFTLAHSVTLALAGLQIITLPSRIVEPVIAATIIFVGVENLRGATRGRYLLTFVFGLMHGFGFAAALRAIGLGSHGAPIRLPLFAFNLGVEAGQIAVASIALPILWRLRRVPLFARHGDRAVSILICVAGAVWLVQRLL
jgi:hydrogenase/urease accessory protein HupE